MPGTKAADTGLKSKRSFTAMKALAATAAFGLALGATIMTADAKGCIKGAIVGGVAGHYAAHHGFLGAAAGCLIGWHMAKKHATATQNPLPNEAHF